LDATVAYSVVDALGIPIFRDGPMFYLPNAQLVVADMCTGILSLIAILALAVFYAYLTQKSTICRTLLVLVAIPVAILGNIIRIILITVLVYFFGISMMDSLIHQFQGTVIFILTFLILILLGSLLKKFDARLMVTRL
jgi:exosortase